MMEAATYATLSFQEIDAIVRNHYRAGHYAILRQHLNEYWKAASSLPELIARLDGQLNVATFPSQQLDPAHRALIDNRFRTLVMNELNKKFGNDLKLVDNLAELVNAAPSLKEVQVKVQYAISQRKASK